MRAFSLDDRAQAHRVGSLLTRFGWSFVQQGSPAWRWGYTGTCLKQYDDNMSELLAIWQMYGLLTSGGDMLSALTLPHSLVSPSGNLNLNHSRYLPEGLVVSKIHDRFLRSLLNLLYLLVPRRFFQENAFDPDPLLGLTGFVMDLSLDTAPTVVSAPVVTTPNSERPTPIERAWPDAPAGPPGEPWPCPLDTSDAAE